MQDYFEIIRAEWALEFKKCDNSIWFQKFALGKLSVEHYKWFLRETYFNARENPQLQTFATSFFRGSQRSVTRKFYQHAIAEIGHDQLALNDLCALGENVDQIPLQRPLPSTAAFTAFGFYQIQFLNPLGYLGYLFHLEFMPTNSGGKYMEFLGNMGVPENAMNFLKEHTAVDVGHNKMMESYIKSLVLNQSDLNEVIWSVKTSCVLHQKMLEGAFESADRCVPIAEAFSFAS